MGSVRVDGRQLYFRVTPQTKLIVAGHVPDEGHRISKIESVIAPRIKQVSGPPDSLKSDQVEFLFSQSLGNTLDTLKAKTEAFVNTLN
jgi:hypothetical protein